MNFSSTNFLYEIFDFNIKKYWKNKGISLIIVTHILPDTLEFLWVLEKYFEISYVIPKPKSINKEIYKIFEKKYDLLELSREKINTDSDFIIEKFEKINKNFIILDIGWYFSEIYLDLKKYFWENFLWIIEDTENWHQKYEKFIEKNKILPILSVARSILKEPEDLHVWKSIVFSTDYILRENNTHFTNKKVSVLWFWKIWKSIARDLVWKNCQVQIFDINPFRKLEALSLWYSVSEREKVLKKADIIFCATWNKSLKNEDYFILKDNVVISSVTSADDELDLDFLKKEFSKEKNKYFDKYKKNGKNIYLLNWWNAVNFVTNEAIWSFIFLVQAEIIHCIFFIINEKIEKWIIKIIDNKEKEYIPKIWLKHFNK